MSGFRKFPYIYSSWLGKFGTISSGKWYHVMFLHCCSGFWLEGSVGKWSGYGLLTHHEFNHFLL